MYSAAYSTTGTVTYPNGDANSKGKFIYIEMTNVTQMSNYGLKFSLYESGLATFPKSTSIPSEVP